MAITALRQGGDNAAALACRQRKAAELPAFTPGQCTPKSERHAARTAATCADGGLLLAAAAGGGGGGAAAAGAGFAGAALSVGGGPTASSAALHDGDTLAALRLRHSSASLVPGFTPVHCVMKSERQEARIAEICSDVGCWAEAASEVPTTSPVAINRRTARQHPNFTQAPFLPGGTLHIGRVPSSMRCIAVARRLCDAGLVC
jgi:hypothetical protein